jgi:hypothetical protein
MKIEGFGMADVGQINQHLFDKDEDIRYGV